MSDLKTKEDYAKEYSRFISWDEHDKIYVVRIPELPGCATHGSTTKEAFEMADEAILSYLDALEDLGRPFPLPAARIGEDQKFVLRLDMPTHQLVKFAAEELGISMNDYIVDRLAGSYHVINIDKPGPFMGLEGKKKARPNKQVRPAGAVLRAKKTSVPKGTKKRA